MSKNRDYRHYTPYLKKREKPPICTHYTEPSEMTKRAKNFEPLGIALGIIILAELCFLLLFVVSLFF